MDTAVPKLGKRQVLVRTTASLISAGTDRAVLQLGKKNSLAKAIARPDLVQKVWQKIRRDGFLAAFRAVRSAIKQPKPLGYSLVGEVLAVGSEVLDFAPGQRVACAGHGFASHAEVVAVPINLCVQVPDEVNSQDACYVTLGAIAMHGLRQSKAIAGCTVMVVGLGLLGQLSMQLARAAGMHPIGVDLDPHKLAFTKQQGMQAFDSRDINLETFIESITQGLGVDAILITAGSPSDSTIFDWLVSFCRDRADIVVVGDVKMAMSRRDYFKKELTIWQSRSYGPGRYDPDYEIAGNDYPITSVRWTENRNMQAFINLLADRKINLMPLTTHRYQLSEFKQAYRHVLGKNNEFYIGIVIDYPPQQVIATSKRKEIKANSRKISLGVIGVGNFSQNVLIPAFSETNKFQFTAFASNNGISASAAVEMYDASYSSTEVSQLLHDKKINAVVIATRHDSHAQYVIEALKAGKHVYVEKPLCTTVAELNEISLLANQSVGILHVGFNRRFSPAIQKIKNFFPTEKPKQMFYRINAGRIPLNSESAWVHQDGGRVLGEMCHFVDTMIAVTKSLPVAIQCHAHGTKLYSLSQQDQVILQINFADGSEGIIHYQTNMNSQVPKEYLEINSENLQAILENFRTLKLCNGSRTKTKRYLGVNKGFKPQAEAFYRACKTNSAAIPIAEIVATHQVVLLAYNLINNPSQQSLVSVEEKR